MAAVMKYAHTSEEEAPSAWVRWWCPGCESNHTVTILPLADGGPVWGFNGNLEQPTLDPSVLVYGHKRSFMPGEPEGTPVRDQPRCHCFVRDGRIQFLDDCEHELHGQTVPMRPL